MRIMELFLTEVNKNNEKIFNDDNFGE